MSALAHDLTARVRSAADYMAEHGWTQGADRDDDGRVCLTGAIRYCAPQTGDEYLICEVLRRRKHAEDWNDSDGRTAVEVESYLRSVEVTDADLADTFGPQWETVVALVRRAATLTPDEVRRLAATRHPARDAARDAAWVAARDAARHVARDAAWDAAWVAARDAARHVARDAAWDAARDAAWALGVRDLIGSHGFTADHYRTLTSPWVRVCGPVHPDDERDGLVSA